MKSNLNFPNTLVAFGNELPHKRLLTVHMENLSCIPLLGFLKKTMQFQVLVINVITIYHVRRIALKSEELLPSTYTTTKLEDHPSSFGCYFRIPATANDLLQIPSH
jgi:hypothetical protein